MSPFSNSSHSCSSSKQTLSDNSFFNSSNNKWRGRRPTTIVVGRERSQVGLEESSYNFIHHNKKTMDCINDHDRTIGHRSCFMTTLSMVYKSHHETMKVESRVTPNFSLKFTRLGSKLPPQSVQYVYL